jgi:protein tyrosine/serine phosphatase
MGHLMKTLLALLVTGLLITLGLGCTPTVYSHGIPNLAVVEPGIWRSGQPTTLEQWTYLKSLGVKRVVKLNFTSEGSDELAKSAGLEVVVLSMQPEGDKDILTNLKDTFVHPDPVLVGKAIEAIDARLGTLIHCVHGMDRTGYLIGVWRVVEGKWTKERAYAEMLAHGFHPELHGLHEAWEDLAPP